ncbi:hypothetical protein GWK47_020403 [Chionoecetes opilio]|uniref:Uncharacterized protein n=1 Tax=Chionoecetes opilio TaxID=41210 RepID=A0A8J4XPU0_CHIOP|nr:hypothetical protein GWK47_020403 [Chionoecetes opilio]
MPLEEKRNVVPNLRSMEGSEEPPPKVCVEEADLDNKTVASFVTKNTEKYLDLLDIDKGSSTSILPCGGRTPCTWPGQGEYVAFSSPTTPRNEGSLLCRISLRTLARSRRTSCNASFKVVEDHRKMYPTAKKYGHMRDMKISSNQYNFFVTLVFVVKGKE